jgi:hypothetical protein
VGEDKQEGGHCHFLSSASTASAPSKHKRTTSTNSTLSTVSVAAGRDVVALVDKIAFNVDLEDLELENAALKRFKNGAACMKWLSKRLNHDPAEGERQIVLVKSAEYEMISTSIEEANFTSRVRVVPYGDEQLVASMDEALEEARKYFSVSPSAPVKECFKEQYSLEEVEGLLWIDEMAGSWRDGSSGPRGFVSAHKAIGWMERQMKLWHVACAACTTKRRCPACCKTYKAGQQKLAWVGDRFNMLVVAHHAPVLKAYLTQFPENEGPCLDLAVYGGKGDTDYLTFEDAANSLGAGGFQLCAPSLTPSTAPTPPETCRSDSEHLDEHLDGDLSDWESESADETPRARTDSDFTEEQLAGLRAMTPVPEDSEFPWLFYDTIRAAQDETLRMAGNLQLELSLENFQLPEIRSFSQCKKQAVTLQHSSSFGSQSGLSPRTTYQPSPSFVHPSTSLSQSFRFVPVQPVQLNSPTVTAVVYPVLQPGWSGY